MLTVGVAAGAVKTPCQQDFERENRPNWVGNYVPQCDERGEYKPLQVHGRTGSSWCVDRNGKELPNTRRTRNQPKPVCTSNEGNQKVYLYTWVTSIQGIPLYLLGKHDDSVLPYIFFSSTLLHFLFSSFTLIFI